MFVKSALLASLSITANAILLPPSVSTLDLSIVNSLPLEAIGESQSRSIDLPCTGCPVAFNGPGTTKVWTMDLESSLQLNFSITQQPTPLGGKSDVLVMNGGRLFPGSQFMPDMLSALQIAKTTAPDTNLNLYLGYSVNVKPIHKSSADHLSLIELVFQVAEIDDKFVDGLESVVINLVQTSTGKLMIASVKTAPTTNAGGKDCNTLICRMKAILADRLARMKAGKGKKGGCGGKKTHNIGKPTKGWTGSGPKWHKHPRPFHQPGHPHHHHGHHHNHLLHKISHAIKRIAFHVFLPLLVGVTVGMTAGVVGLVAGQMIVFFWRAIYRNGRCNYAQLEQENVEEEEVVVVVDEKEEMEGLPAYEDFPKDEKVDL